MRFRYRFAYYLIGFTLGLFFVTAVFIGKDTRCNYFPNARVLNNLRTKPFEFSPKAIEQMKQCQVDSTDIKNSLTYGDVDFDKSNIAVEKGGKKYIIEGRNGKQQNITLEVINYETRAVLTQVTKP